MIAATLLASILLSLARTAGTYAEKKRWLFVSADGSAPVGKILHELAVVLESRFQAAQSFKDRLFLACKAAGREMAKISR